LSWVRKDPGSRVGTGNGAHFSKGLYWGFAVDRLILDQSASACGQCKKGGEDAAQAAGVDVAGARCMGRSRGGSTTNLHALVDAKGLPVKLKLTAGQCHDGRSAEDMLGDLAGAQILLADSAYDSDRVHLRLENRGVWVNVKRMLTRKCGRP
jgi:hypothetical protein